MVRADVDLDRGVVLLEGQYRQKVLLKQVPGARHVERSGHGRWEAPLSWGVANALRGIFGEDLDVSDGLAQWSQAEWETRVAWLHWVRDQTDYPQPDGDVGDWHEKFAPLQRVGAAFLAGARRALLADPMGGGKTGQTILALRLLADRGEPVLPCLVVCPNSAKRAVWEKELSERWPEATVSIVAGTAKQRKEAIAAGADFTVINWEALSRHSRLAPYGSIKLKKCSACGGPKECLACGGGDKSCEACGGRRRVTPASCESHEKELNAIEWGSIVADESHRAKDQRAKQTRALWWLGRQSSVTARYALSGTPIEKSPDQAWPQLHFVSPDDWPRRSQFVERYCETGWSPYGQDIIGLRADRREEFFAVLDTMHLRRPKELLIPFLPPKVYGRRVVEMSVKQKKAYGELRDRGATMVEGGALIAASKLVRSGRLSQLASAWAEVEWGDDEGLPAVRLADPSCKVDALEELIEDAGGGQLVVFAESRQLIELCAKRLERRGISHCEITGAVPEQDRASAVAEFQAGRRQVILLTFGAGAEGLTLTAAPTLVFLQRAWSSTKNLQAEDRIHRPGAERWPSVQIIDVVTAGTIDERRLDLLDEKGEVLEELLRDEATLARLLA